MPLITCDCDTDLDLDLPGPRLKRIHVNQHRLRHNLKTGEREPAITVKQSDANHYGHRVDILDAEGKVLASVVQEDAHPLNCGARVWVETEQPVVVHQHGAAVALYDYTPPGG